MEQASSNDFQRPISIEERRQPTDKYFIFVLLAIFVTWLVISITAFHTNERIDESELFVELKEKAPLCKSLVNGPITRFYSYEFIVMLILSTGFILIHAIIVEHLAKTCIYIGTAECLLLLFIITLGVFILSVLVHYLVGFFLISLWCLFEVAILAGAFSLHKLGSTVPSNMIKKVWQIIIASPFLLLFAGLCRILRYFVEALTVNAILNYSFSDQSPFRILFFILIILESHIILSLFIDNFALMVSAQYTANCYRKNDTKSGLGNSILQVLRYHTGTITFSSLFGIPIICSIIQALRHKRSQDRNESFIYYLTSKFWLTLSLPFTALIYSSIYGTNFLKSSEKTLNEILRRCTFYLATTWVIAVLLLHFSVLVVCVFYGGIVLLLEFEDNEDLLTHSLVLNGFFLPWGAFSMLMHNAATALMVTEIIILNEAD